MVLATPVGRPRRFVAGFGLALATFGVYGYYWHLRVHDELYRQFELAREDVRHGYEFLLLSFFLPPLAFVYHHRFAATVQVLRRRMGRRGGVSPGAFVALSMVAWIAAVGGLIATVVFLSLQARDRACESLFCLLDGIAWPVEAILALGAGTGIWVLLKATACGLLQRDVNEVWALYAARSRVLRGAPAAAPGTAGPGSQDPLQPRPPQNARPPNPLGPT